MFGVESPENEAKRLQIAGIAQRQYPGHVSIAVGDPNVRKMLMPYSESTRQKMPLSATTRGDRSLEQLGVPPRAHQD